MSGVGKGPAAGALLGVLVLTACSAASRTDGSGASQGGPPATTSRSSPSNPPPTATPSGGCRYRIGQTLDLRDPANGAALRVRPTDVALSRTRLSADHGYPPQNGVYVSVTVTITDTGSTPVDISPRDFYLSTPGTPRTTVDDGSSPYSGADNALDATELEPGRSVSGPLTFDVKTPHGELVYAPGGGTSTDALPAAEVCSWTL